MARLMTFADLLPTLLSIIGVQIPDYVQGSAFLGEQKTKDPQYAYLSRQRMDERYDLVRAVRDKQYRYIRNYMPFRITMQHVRTLFNDPSAQSWEDAFKAGKTNAVQSQFFLPKPVEELYDTENDPWGINNLASDPAFAEVLARMRNVETEWMRKIRDVGLIPETEYSDYFGGKSMYDYMRSEACPFEELMKASDLALFGGPDDIDTFVGYLKNENSAVRYWGVTGLLILKDAARPAIPALKEVAFDKAGAVATFAAEALYGLGEIETARRSYINLLGSMDVYDSTDRNFALNSIDAINDASPEALEAIQKLDQDLTKNPSPVTSTSGYERRMIPYLLKKWEAGSVASDQPFTKIFN